MNIYFGENIRRLRREKELTQETLADFLGVSFQAVSKWERGETFPDITMLPSIASFFNVTTDCLLGVDKVAQEAKIQEYIDGYYKSWQLGKIDEVRENLKRATLEFPGDYRLLVRYLNALLYADECDAAVRNEAASIYGNIQSYCAEDSIRIWAKKIMCNYYKKLCMVENSGVTLDDAENILNGMPLMQNSRDYYATFFYTMEGMSDKRAAACKNAIQELIFMLGSVIINTCRCNETDRCFKINAVKCMLGITDSVYPDGDYGKSFLNVIRNHAWLGRWYYEAGDTENSVAHFKASISLAAKFDAMPDESVCTSSLVSGIAYNKKSTPMYASRPETDNVMRFIDESQIDDEVMALMRQ